MPKINVYLPEELAAAVRAAGISVSPVCQRALSEEVQMVGAIRSTIEQIRERDFDFRSSPQVGSRIWGHMTGRLRDATRIALELSIADGSIYTSHLLMGLLEQGDNLGIRVLQALNVDVDDLRSDAAAIESRGDDPTPAPAHDGEGISAGLDPGKSLFWIRLTRSAQMTIAAALESSLELGHRYLGCEHLLLGLLEEKESGAGLLLRSFEVTPVSVQRSIASAVSGFNYARDTSSTQASDVLEEVLSRLAALEHQFELQRTSD